MRFLKANLLLPLALPFPLVLELVETVDGGVGERVGEGIWLEGVLRSLIFRFLFGSFILF